MYIHVCIILYTCTYVYTGTCIYIIHVKYYVFSAQAICNNSHTESGH